jgi:hypothetical protein
MIGKEKLIDIFAKKKWKYIDYQLNENYNKTLEIMSSNPNLDITKDTHLIWDLYFACFSLIVLARS